MTLSAEERNDVVDSRPAPCLADGGPLGDILEGTRARHLGNRDGALADYIPELAAVEPDPFGIAIATVDGRLIATADAEIPFTIQSVSKAFVYCLALELVGRDAVHELSWAV